MTTLTYDASSDPVVMGQVDADQAESLEIGEALQQEQEALLAGKYRNAEDLEQAYIELQKKLGSGSQDDQEEEYVDDEVEDSEDYSFFDQLNEELDSGEFSEETMQALENLSAQEIADLLYTAKQSAETEPAYQSMTAEQIDDMKGIVGGEENYQQLIGWAAENLNPQEIEIYDQVMDRGDPSAIYFAIQALNYRYQDSVGVDGQLLTGNSPKGGDTFRSQAELVRAMADPRYDRDPAYRQDVIAKLERSDIDF